MCQPDFHLEQAESLLGVIKSLNAIAEKFRDDKRACDDGAIDFMIASMGIMDGLKGLYRRFVQGTENDETREEMQKKLIDFLGERQREVSTSILAEKLRGRSN